ncbi:MAG: autotransporter outer membrane beta-barrel domain-containing protein, partial [Pseudomonas sp.]
MLKERSVGYQAVLAASILTLHYLQPPTAQAACALTPGPGDDTFVCDSGSSPGLTDLLGNNRLTLPAGGTGTINGNVTFGAGVDAVQIDSGRITGAVQQGNGIDDFKMSGGQIQSLAQGDGRDTFLMTGGTIVGAFEDGDVARQTGGTIGRVDMKLDNNIYDMSGGAILGNLVTGFGTDTIIVSGGTIGGNISVSGGDDSITVSGGTINGEIRASVGNDTFNWLNGGQIKSAVLMGDGNDTVLLRGLSESLLATTPSIDGGLGNDQLTFDNTTSSTAARYIGWETVNLNNNARFDLAGDFFLGDSASGTGTLNIDGSSSLAVTQGSLRPYTAGQLATLNNAGTIDMTTGSNSATDTFTLHGNYVGNNGQLWLQTVLGDDTSATDKLVVSDGTLSGHTQLAVTNLGGAGGFTANNGIEVVQALNGAVSSNDAFALKGSVSAGAYEYLLFKGGVTAGTENNWYLRSSVVAVQPPAVPPVTPTPPVVVPVPPLP